MSVSKQLEEAVYILKSRCLRTSEYDDKITIYNDYPHLKEIAKPGVLQYWNLDNSSDMLIINFLHFMCYLCKQSIVVHLKEYPPRRQYYTTKKDYIEWQGGIMYSLETKNSTVTVSGIIYTPEAVNVVYRKEYRIENDISYITVVGQLAILFSHLITKYTIILPTLSFKNRKDFEQYEIYMNMIMKKMGEEVR